MRRLPVSGREGELITVIVEELQRFDRAFEKALGRDGGFLLPFLPSSLFRGKRLRPAIYFLAQGLAGRSPDVVEAVVVWELIHTASLIHDDVVDGASLRRGGDSLNGLHDNRLSVLVGDSLWAVALEHALEVPLDGFMPLVSGTVLAMSKGELVSTLNAGKMIARDAYIESVANKTAALFEGVCVSGGLAASASDETIQRLREFGRAFGMGFQFHDDIADLTGAVEGKHAGLDARGGRATLPLILAWERAEAYEREKILVSMPKDKPWHADKLQQWADKMGGIESAKQMMETELDRAEAVLDGFPDSDYNRELHELIRTT